MDDFVLNVRQIVQYPLKSPVAETDLVLLQESVAIPGAAGAYRSATVADLVSTALQQGGFIHLAPESGIAWNGAALMFSGGLFSFTEPVSAPNLMVGTAPVATQAFVINEINALVGDTVDSFNGRSGDVQLETPDILRAGGAPIVDAHFGGFITAPTPWDVRGSSDQVATTAFVRAAICFRLQEMLSVQPILLGHDPTQGAHPIGTADVNAAYGVTNTFPATTTPPLGDASNRIATTLFVDDTIEDLKAWIINQIAAATSGQFAPINSPNFTGIPTAPTANPGTNTGQLATTAFVIHAVTAATTGVASFNTRTGAVVLTGGDITGAGGALLVSPVFTGVPTAPTAAPGTNSQQLATTAFVTAALSALPTAGVSSFNGRLGAVVLTTGDITAAGGAPLTSPALTGTPTAPTAAQTVNDTTIATTAYVQNAIAAMPTSVSSFNGRTGAITLQGSDVSAAGGALLGSPTFTGTPAAPTATAGTNTTQLATCAFVQAAITAGTAGVASFNGRTGAVTLTTADITSAGGALLTSPTFIGVPTAPTPAQASNDTTLATTAYVRAAIAAVNTGVASFNGRTGAVTLQGSDVSGAGGALVASPTFTGTPSAPTATAGTNTTQLATTAFVMNQIATAGGVTTFNGRAGAVTLTLADVTATNVLNNTPLIGVPTAPTAAPGTNNTQVASTAFVAAAAGAGGIKSVVVQMFTVSGIYTPTTGMKFAQVECVGGGGGGGGVTAVAGYYIAAAGGGSGGYSRKLFNAATIGPNQQVFIGVGGTGTAQNDGTAGGDTQLGTLCIAKGGLGGKNFNNLPVGGAGGPVSGAIGDVTAAGAPGANGGRGGGTVVIGGGGGGSSIYGGGAPGTMTTSGAVNGLAGSSYGSGGSGAMTFDPGANAAGGNGSNGVLIITEFVG